MLDVGKPAGRAALIAILKDADVFITNVRPGRAEAPRGYQTTRA